MITNKVCFIYENADGHRNIRWAMLGDTHLMSNEENPMPQLVNTAWDLKKLAYRHFAIHKMIHVKPLTIEEVLKEKIIPFESVEPGDDRILILEESDFSGIKELFFVKTPHGKNFEGRSNHRIIGYKDIEV